MVSTDERMRERATLLAELWPGEQPRPAANGHHHGTASISALSGRLLRTREVALLFQVSERAVTDWARRGRLPSVRTPGGHRRYPAAAVRDLLESVGLHPR
jgi:excisionase family DNA binding protein